MICFPVDIQIFLLHFLLLVLRLVFHIDCNGLYPGRDRCAHGDRRCGCVLAHPNRFRVLTLAMDGDGNWVPWVHAELGRALVFVEVGVELRWGMLWQYGSLHIRAHSLCSSGRSRPRRLSSHCPLLCRLYCFL